jgi:LCP family protein required for cell wall assembly
VVGAVAAAAFLASIFAGAIIFRKAHSVARAIAVVHAPVQAVERVFNPDPVAVFGKDRLLVLVIGLDYDYDNLDEETSEFSRSDIIMALQLDFKNRRINEVSVPRDMVATMPSGQKAKINQAQSEGGIKESRAVIADWLGIPAFDRFIVMRIDTSKDLIDAIGGIDVAVENSSALKGSGRNGPLDYDDNWGHLHVHLKPGMQHLDGEHAVGYARFRHDWCSDPCRILRQQQVIRALVQKIEHDKLNTVAHAQQLLHVIHKDIETDLTTREELTAAVAFSHLTPQDIHTAQIPSTGDVDLPDYGDSLIPDYDAKEKITASMLAVPAEDVSQASPSAITQSDPSSAAHADVRVRVQNGTTIPGLAARVAGDLRRQGFTIAEIGNAPTQDFAVTEIRTSPKQASASILLRKALGASAAEARISTTTPKLEKDVDVTVVLGRDIGVPNL